MKYKLSSKEVSKISGGAYCECSNGKSGHFRHLYQCRSLCCDGEPRGTAHYEFDNVASGC